MLSYYHCGVKIISGGQSGVDRAALDAAILLGIDYGGSIPQGRRAEDGPIDGKYSNLVELESEDYRSRTEKNVADADATLVITIGKPTEGTAYTLQCARKHHKQSLTIDLGKGEEATDPADVIRAWILKNRPSILNVAGPRESKVPGIYRKSLGLLLQIFREFPGMPG